MKRNHSYSLQKINPNKPTVASRVVGPRQRLIFPSEKDSGLYSSVGRKHYENSTHVIHKLLFNPESNTAQDKNRNNLLRNMSEGYLKTPYDSEIAAPKPPPPPAKPIKIQQSDSLLKLERQFERKEGNLNMSPKRGLHSEPITRKNQLSAAKNQNSNLEKNNSYLRLFGSVDNLYEMVNKQNRYEPLTRKMNPTYLSSELGLI